MRIGIYANWQVTVSDKGFYISSLNSKYLEKFAVKSEGLTLLSSSNSNSPPEDSVFVSYEQVSLLPLPDFKSYAESAKYFFTIINGIKKLYDKNDFLFIRVPDPFSWILMMLPKREKTIHYHFVSNPFEVIFGQKGVSIFKKIVRAALYYPEFLFCCFSAWRFRASCTGDSIPSNLPLFLRKKIRPLIESSLTKEDIDKIEPAMKTDRSVLRLLYVGRIHPGKGIEDLLQACRMLSDRTISYSLTVVGSGFLENEIKELAHSLDLSDRVCFVGQVKHGDELSAYYISSDVFILPSLSEAGPRVLLEAMAYSVFCISTSVGYAPYLIGEDRGLLVKTNAPESITESILWFLDNREKANKITESACTFAKEHTLDNFVDEVLSSDEYYTSSGD
jgi:glycosyltransferase involved in cell wall biosynthesis